MDLSPMLRAAAQRSAAYDGPRNYAPKHDPNGSLVLVLHIRAGLDSDPFCETLASFGSHIGYAFEVDQAGQEGLWAAGFGLKPDGLYVLRCRWHGSGEDSELLVVEERPLDDEERAHIAEDSGTDAIIHAWVKEWAEVPCRCCGHVGSAHTGYDLACPKEVPDAPERP